jgi:hypothetical protein
MCEKLAPSMPLGAKAGRVSSFRCEISNITHPGVPGVPDIRAVHMVDKIREAEFEHS